MIGLCHIIAVNIGQKACPAPLFSHKAMCVDTKFQARQGHFMTQQARISFFLPPILFWGLIGGFVFLRSVMVMLSPLELGVDEAQLGSKSLIFRNFVMFKKNFVSRF